jgi:N-methylhydantoinase A
MALPRESGGYSIGTDIGGTFTDCVVVDEDGAVTTGKSPSTPPNFSTGFFDAIGDAAGKLDLSADRLLTESRILVHATTAATNAMVERRGARVGLLTTKGHAETTLIMRGGGRSKGLDVDELLYIPGSYKPEPIVPRGLIAEVTERVDASGDVIVQLNEQELRAGVEQLLAAGAETIAVGFLWSLLYPRHEQRAREVIEEIAPGTFVSLSSEIAPQIGEYYRIVATVFNSYVGPLMTQYVGNIEAGATARGAAHSPLFAQCVGGTVPVEEVKRKPLFTLDSGPVSGLVASNFLGTQFGYSNIITADMGGTTLDVAVIADNKPKRREGTTLDKYHMYLPMLDVESIGAGGGSIAWIDPSSGTMKVGPHSAGAEPGPICYQRGGTKPTVTDADVVLGIINPDRFLGGRRRLDAAAAREGVGRLGREIGLSPEETAAGISEIIDNVMADKIRRMTVYRGHDPRDFAVFAFGGAGPMHAAAFAQALAVSAVVVPIGNLASVLSALGTISTDVTHLYDRATRLVAPFDLEAIAQEFGSLEAPAREQLEREGFGPDAVRLVRTVAMKYGAQVFDIEIPFSDGVTGDELVDVFESTYEQRYGVGSGYAPAGIEIIRLRLTACGMLDRPSIAKGAASNGATTGPVGTRPVWWRETGGWAETPVYHAVAERDGAVDGPAIVELPDTTVVVRPGQCVASDGYGNLVITLS